MYALFCLETLISIYKAVLMQKAHSAENNETKQQRVSCLSLAVNRCLFRRCSGSSDNEMNS